MQSKSFTQHPTPARSRRLGWSDILLITVLGPLVGVYALALLLHGDGYEPLIDAGLATLTKAAILVVCWAAVARTKRGQLLTTMLLAALAVTVVVAADTAYLLALPGGAQAGFPSLTNVGYLVFYALMTAVMILMVRNRTRGLSRWVLLDSAIGVLGTSSVLAAVLAPHLWSVGEPHSDRSVIASIAYALFNLLLALVLAAIAASQGPDASRRWVLLVFGLMIFTATDVVFAIIGGGYSIGTPLDAGWVVGLTLIAVWLDASARPRTPLGTAAHSVAAVVLPVVSTVAALGVLVIASVVPVSAVAVGLAAVTMGLAAVPLASRQIMFRRQSHTDDLTGLPNRRSLYSEASARLGADPGHRRALLLLDVDRFKEVNDSLGHDAGDRLLRLIGSRLSAEVPHGDVLVRLGGDEFAILLEDSGRLEAETTAIRLRSALAVPFTLEGIALQTSVSFGIALYPDQGDDLAGLLGKADVALYKAKSTQSGHHVYRSSDNSHGEARLRTLEELRQGLVDEQLVLHFQPKIDLRTGAVNAVEALVRWNHPDRGLLYPDQFLTLAEDAGLMHSLTEVVLSQALDQAADWQRRGRPLTVAVNLSASSLVDSELPERVGAMLESRGLPASALTLEITEGFLMADRDRAREILTRLRASGIRIAVDDFGTGYSSLAYLRDLPIDELKLDQSFVFPMASDARASALVASTIDLAHGLGLRMVAEGVENGVAYDALVRFGCDDAQGYFMSRPVAAAVLDQWIDDRSTARIPQ